MNKILSYFLLVALSVALTGCGCEGDPSDEEEVVVPDPVTSVSFAKGADISWASEMLSKGITFKDGKGAEGIFPVLKNLGMNSIRLRVWVNPIGGSSWSGQADLVNMAKVNTNNSVGLLREELKRIKNFGKNININVLNNKGNKNKNSRNKNINISNINSLTLSKNTEDLNKNKKQYISLIIDLASMILSFLNDMKNLQENIIKKNSNIKEIKK
ncbi:MAG: glycosyl hydrolase 53 family protein, partial [Bacteroidales bacterium]|nr:glycosyl hydrolase 53 family protein [Bacteroidales bacterium]